MTSAAEPDSRTARLWNVPNQITAARLVLTVLMYVLLDVRWYLGAFCFFLLAAGTDWLDGFLARRTGQITKLGRILDPFADKMLICGAFIFLAAVPPMADGTRPSAVAAWMAVVILGRELLVTVLRSFIESHGGDFSARWVGKWKMGLQCVAAAWSMFVLSYLDASGDQWATQPPQWMSSGLVAVVWTSVLFTVYSGVEYVSAGMKAIVAED